MHVRVPALHDESCPKCGAITIGTKVVVWRVADERGPGLECDACAHRWPITPISVIITAKDVRI